MQEYEVHYTMVYKTFVMANDVKEADRKARNCVTRLVGPLGKLLKVFPAGAGEAAEQNVPVLPRVGD